MSSLKERTDDWTEDMVEKEASLPEPDSIEEEETDSQTPIANVNNGELEE